MNHPPCHSAIEPLESRIAPGLVTFAYDGATGALSIMGSDTVDVVTVLRVGPNHYRLETGSDSFLPGLRSFVDLEKVTSVDILGQGGNDRFNLIDLNNLKSLTVHLGDGNDDRLFTSNLTVTGTVTINDAESATLGGAATRIAKNLQVNNTSLFLASEQMLIGGSLLWTNGSESNFIGSSSTLLSIAKGVQIESGSGPVTITLDATARLTIGKLPSGESIRFIGGTGNDRLRLGSPSVKLSGGIHFNGGLGNDAVDFLEGAGTVTIGKLPNAGSIRFEGGGGDDDLLLAARVVKTTSGIEFFGGEGANRFLVENPAARLTIGKSASGASLHLTDGSAQSEWNLTAAEWILKGGVQVAPGDGDSTLTLTGDTKISIGKLATGQSLLYSGGAGEDQLTLGGATTTLAGWIEAPFAANNAVMEIFGDRLRIGKSATGVSLLSSCSLINNSTLTSAAGKLAGSIELDLPGIGGFFHMAGNLSIGKNTSGTSLHVVSGAGPDILSSDRSRLSFAGDVRFEGNGGDDIVGFSNLHQFTTKGSVYFDGGAGEDDFTLESLALQVAGSIHALGGDDREIVALVANGSIAGDLRIDLGTSTAFPQRFIIQSLDGRVGKLSIKGELNLSGASAGDEFVIVENVQVGRKFTGTFGAGNLTARFDNLSVRDTFDLSTGDGEDSVEIERKALFGNSVIGRLATIQTGGGNDSVLIGLAIPSQDGPFDSTRVRFLGGLTLNGGPGTDTRNDLATQNDFPATPPTGLDTFEQVTAF